MARENPEATSSCKELRRLQVTVDLVYVLCDRDTGASLLWAGKPGSRFWAYRLKWNDDLL